MAEQGFTLSSPEFSHGGLIPASCSCDGDNISPQLDWLHPPEGTRSFALIVDDPDSPQRTFTHWVLFDIPASTSTLARGKTEVGVAGRNDFQQRGYGGPCPPPQHDAHRYFFKLFALDRETLELKGGATRSAVEQAIQGHILGQTELMGRYRRGPAKG